MVPATSYEDSTAGSPANATMALRTFTTSLPALSRKSIWISGPPSALTCSTASLAPFPKTSPYTAPEVENGITAPIFHVSPAPADFASIGPRNFLIVAISAAERAAPPAALAGLAAAVPPPLPAVLAVLPLPLLHASSSGNATAPATKAAPPRRKAARLTARPGDGSPDRDRSELVIKFPSVSLIKQHLRKCH